MAIVHGCVASDSCESLSRPGRLHRSPCVLAAGGLAE